MKNHTSAPARSQVLVMALGIMLATSPAISQDSPAPSASQRLRIGLVLGGGGAKGAAHIGVLRVLDEMRIPVDCVTGTSMGALVGGTFAAGMPAEEIQREILAINWSKTVGTEGLRDRTPIHRKLGGLTYTNSLDLGIKDGGIKASSGLLKTQDIEDVIRGLVSDARFTRDFDDLPIPFRAVATDMLAGQMVVLEKGDLSVAMRASMAVPGAFSPVLMGDKVLADGGMMRNLPVDIARGLCADVVIAVSLASPPPKAEDLNSAVGLAGRSLDVMIDANQTAQLATLTERDVSIVVPMGDIGSASFDRVPDAIPLGYAAARGKLDELRRYAVPEDQYLAWRQSVNQPADGEIQLAEVRLVGLERVNPEYVRAQLVNVVPGARVTTQQITEDTGRVFALGDFEKVEYRLKGPATARVLEIRAVEKAWGPDFVRFDLGLTGGTGGDLRAIVRFDHDRTWVNSLGGEWHNTMQMGLQTIGETNFYQPFDVRQRFFIQPLARFEQNLEDVYNDGERIARYYLQEGYGQVDLGLNMGTTTQLRVGLRQGLIDSDRDTGPTVLPEKSAESEASAIARVVYDTRDAVGLPTHGTFLNARYQHSGSWFGGEQDYDLAEGVITQSFPFRGDALSLIVGGGKELSGELPATQEFQLGGIQTFPGLQPGELRGDSYWYAGSVYYWKVGEISSLFGQSIYAGLRLQAGRMGGRIDSIINPDVDNGALHGMSVSLGGRTPIGPMVVSLGVVDNNSTALQFSIGRPIAEGSMLQEIR